MIEHLTRPKLEGMSLRDLAPWCGRYGIVMAGKTRSEIIDAILERVALEKADQ